MVSPIDESISSHEISTVEMPSAFPKYNRCPRITADRVYSARPRNKKLSMKRLSSLMSKTVNYAFQMVKLALKLTKSALGNVWPNEEGNRAS